MYKLSMTVQGRRNQGRTRETKLCFPPYLGEKIKKMFSFSHETFLNTCTNEKYELAIGCLVLRLLLEFLIFVVIETMTISF